MKYLIYILSFFALHGTFAQTISSKAVFSKKELPATKKVDYLLLEKDSLQDMAAIDLDEVVLIGRYNFKDRKERHQYLILKRKTFKVWPYAVLASDRLQALRKRLGNIKTKSDKKRYTKIVQNYMEDEFKEELKKLTKTEGQILVKLMYRQTGETTFDVVKDLKSGWNAFWYNTTASLFNISLKEEFDPIQVKEDYMIEHILRRAFRTEELESHDAKIDISFLEAMKKWK